VEGDLLTATAAKLYPSDTADVPKWDQDNASRVALIARDNVCVNTTALNPRPSNVLHPDDQGRHYNDGQPIYPSDGGYPPYMFFRGPTDQLLNSDPGAWNGTDLLPTDPAYIDFGYRNVRLWTPQLKATLSDLRLIIGHSGWCWWPIDTHTGAPPVGTGYESVAVNVLLQYGSPLQSWPSTSGYTFGHDGSDHWYQDPARDDPFTGGNDYLEFLPKDSYPMSLDPAVLSGVEDLFRFSSTITPAKKSDNSAWLVKPQELGYVLGPIAVAPPRDKPALPVEIDALVYAQNGSWFVLPGPWFNEDPDEVSTSKPYPGYHEPLNIRLAFYGAITENMPAPVGDVADWTSKWCGPSGTTATGFLQYVYDAQLHWYRKNRALQQFPIFPYLPMTPDMLIWGERVSGAGGAGI
jgi:hypothetical protein